jgi:alcohol dehydrogenase/acrylyl-CoA reductase (NADPH)
MPFIIRGVKLWGVDSVTAPAKRREFLWSQATSYVDFDKLSEGAQEWSFDDLISSSSKILKGEVSGRVIVNVNK